MARCCYVLILVLASIVSPGVARGTVLVTVPIEELARSSAAVVIGRVEALSSVEAKDGNIFTLVDLSVEEVLKGDIDAPLLTLKEDGGAIGSLRKIVFGSPNFEIGERVLLFLAVRPDGSLQTNQLALGKFSLKEVTHYGMTQARRDLGRGSTVITSPGGGAPPLTMPLLELRRAIKAAAMAPAGSTRHELRLEPPEASDPSLRREEATGGFELLGMRFFEADEGLPMRFVVDPTHDSFLGFDAARQAWNAAMAVWTDVPTATIVLQDAGV